MIVFTRPFNFTDPYGEPKPKWDYLKRLFNATVHWKLLR